MKVKIFIEEIIENNWIKMGEIIEKYWIIMTLFIISTLCEVLFTLSAVKVVYSEIDII